MMLYMKSDYILPTDIRTYFFENVKGQPMDELMD